ncbi:dual specificity protein phosphatase [Trypanosoma theileri]|uniref:Dual specificity protein phosphatase n=1 Tax=Trypanosoma theileri TaxID=67003 RepID=A0A1X0NRN9_9TRYP|nr:dual specificity protein phosphatase [Trypanosoma theileri]ORC87153.1 dual specificity protein phosphatase [Trypanosoma theileri]
MATLERKTSAVKDTQSMSSSRAQMSSELQRVFAVLRFISEQQQQQQQQQQSLGKENNEAYSTDSSMPSIGRESNNNSNSSSRIKCNSSSDEKQDGISLPSKPLAIPEEVAMPLEKFRMAVTNLPIQKEAVCATREALHTALLQVYSHKASEVDELCSKDSFVGGPKPENMPTFMLTGVYTMQGMQEIVPGLFVGSYHPATDKALLTRHHITHILCCIGTQPRFPGEFVYMTIAAEDNTAYKISKFFPKTSAFIEKALIDQHSAVLVHCGAGISRAPTIAAAYLMKKLRLSAGAAIALIQQKRQVASPNIGFRQQLREYQTELGI